MLSQASLEHKPQARKIRHYFVCVSNKVFHAKCLLVLYQVMTNKGLLSNDIMRFGLVSGKR